MQRFSVFLYCATFGAELAQRLSRGAFLPLFGDSSVFNVREGRNTNAQILPALFISLMTLLLKMDRFIEKMTQGRFKDLNVKRVIKGSLQKH